MASSLILHKRINTTVAKAKALRGYVEPLITKSKDDTTHSRRIVFSYLKDKFAVTELFRNISGKVADRPGGYTRIIKLGKRLGDNAEMAMIELVDYNELLMSDTAKKAKSTRRRRGGSKKKTSESNVEAVATDVVEDIVPEEVAMEDVVEEKVTDEVAEDIAVGDAIVEKVAEDVTIEEVVEEKVTDEVAEDAITEEVVEEVKEAVEDVKKEKKKATPKTAKKKSNTEDEKKED
jgi:large subunit ribosomal protein L17